MWAWVVVLLILAIYVIVQVIEFITSYFSEILFIVLGLAVFCIIIWKHDSKLKRIAEEKRQILRDSDYQKIPCKYELGNHGNQTLAIRYGIANTRVITIPYFYYAKGGKKTRNHDRDKKKIEDANFIKIRKIKPLKKPNCFLVELTDYKKRLAIAVHEKGTDYIKTFLPLKKDKEIEDAQWYKRFKELELALKDNQTFTLKELARFHVEKTVPGATKL